MIPRRGRRHPGDLVDGFRYVWNRPDLLVILLMLFLVGTFALNFPIFLSTMAVQVFHSGSGSFGLLTSAAAVGSVIGALLSARRAAPRVVLLPIGAALFGSGLGLAAVMPTYGLFALVLVLVGVSGQTFTTTANGAVQLATDPVMRGRVIAILLAVMMGGTPIGGPIIGWVTDAYGPRWGLGVGAAGGLAAALVGVAHLIVHRRLRLRRHGWQFRFSLETGPVPDELTGGTPGRNGRGVGTAPPENGGRPD